MATVRRFERKTCRSLWRRTNAQSGVQFTLSTNLKIPNYPVILSHQRRTTIVQRLTPLLGTSLIQPHSSYLTSNMWFSFLFIRFKSRYTEKDYPVQVKLRQDLYFEASVKSKDKTLSVLGENCVATPTQDSKHATSYPLITNGLVMLF